MEPTIHTIERRERRGRALPAFVILFAVGFIAATWLGLFSFLGTNAAFGTLQDLEDHYICNAGDLALDFPDLSRLSEVYTSDGVLLGKLNERNSQPTPLDEIPEEVLQVVLAAEDSGFYSHEGIDFKAILRAVVEDVKGGSRQGGSTITQQVVKSVFLSNEQTLERKVCEAVIAAELERRYTKDEILEFYVNSVFYGANAYGLTAAAQEYFGKTLDQLTIAETAAMVTPIRNPSLYDLRDRPQTVLRARNAVIDNMANKGFITEEVAEIEKRRELAPIPHEEFEQLAPQVIIAAREELLNDAKFGLGETFEERKLAVFGCPAADADCEGGGGLTIHLTLDFALQTEANRILREWFPPGWDGPTGAIASVDNATGAIRVIASGLDFGDDFDAGQRDYDLATKGVRQPGSSFKPFTLVAALESGGKSGRQITLGSYWDMTSPQKIDCGFPCSPTGNIWTCENASRSGSGLRTLEQATYLSTNAVYCQVAFEVGPEKIVDVAHRMGIESPLDPVLSIALGTEEVSPLEMANAYSTLANYGERRTPYLIERIEDSDGNIIYEHVVEKTQVLDRALTAAVVSAMEKTVCCGTGTAANIGRPQAGKTGTAQESRDVWFMGYIPQITTAVWVGYPDALIPMVDFTVYNALEGRDQYIRRAFGGNIPAPIWKQFMLIATENLPIEDFPPEPDGTSAYRQVPKNDVPDVSDLTESEAKSAILKAGFNPSIVEVPSTEPLGKFLSQSPAAGTSMTQGQSVTVEYSSGVPPTAPLPSWVGITQGEVAGALAAFTESTGIVVTVQTQQQPTADPALIGRVVATSPGPGQVVANGQTVLVFIGVALESGDT
ncbi:MAG: PASTA domain-containing protein [Acidimicrobiia bacterium]|nr:PASTA domain-containing protein [Acidimicrobiia bacterium]